MLPWKHSSMFPLCCWHNIFCCQQYDKYWKCCHVNTTMHRLYVFVLHMLLLTIWNMRMSLCNLPNISIWFGFSQQILINVSGIKFHRYPTCVICTDMCRQTYGQMVLLNCTYEEIWNRLFWENAFYHFLSAAYKHED